MAKKKQLIEVVEFTKAEKKALEKLDHSHLLIEIQVIQDCIEELQKKIYKLNENVRITNEQNLALTLKMESDIIKKRVNKMHYYSNMNIQKNKQLKKQKVSYKEKMKKQDIWKKRKLNQKLDIKMNYNEKVELIQSRYIYLGRKRKFNKRNS
ncbi:unnamed protein product [Paramecium sonneborni]|uniref:Uncharacterized protein n=1 Tax=Paramecium sonneborni TaxID=65129 RepID=A0A8S1LBK5_9CILI|nr:unnamed protein product [Paramecium sonneborni]